MFGFYFRFSVKMTLRKRNLLCLVDEPCLRNPLRIKESYLETRHEYILSTCVRKWND